MAQVLVMIAKLYTTSIGCQRAIVIIGCKSPELFLVYSCMKVVGVYICLGSDFQGDFDGVICFCVSLFGGKILSCISWVRRDSGNPWV
jgi:hypothetical protein